MTNKTLIKTFRTSKIIQFCITFILEIFFVIVLLTNYSELKQILSNRIMVVLCSTVWLLFVSTLFFLLYDFFKLRTFDTEHQTLNKVAYVDKLTGLPNRHGLDTIFQTYNSPESIANMGCYMAVIDNLGDTNETLGYEAGSVLIKQFSFILNKLNNDSGIVGRNGGNEFISIINNCNQESMEAYVANVNKKIDKYNEDNSTAPIVIKYSYVVNQNENNISFTQLIASVYKKLHK